MAKIISNWVNQKKQWLMQLDEEGTLFVRNINVESGDIGGVTSITAGHGLLGGTIVQSGTIDVDFGSDFNQVARGNHFHNAASIPILDNGNYYSATNVEDALQELNSQLAIRDNAISLKASQTTVDSLGSRVTTAESELVVQAGQIATKVKQSTFDTLSGRVDTAETSIVQNANAITLKASQSSVDDLTGRVSSAEASITTQADAIALKANQTTVDTVSAVANSKAKTFLSTPTTPYYVGDIWIDTNATTGGNKVCTTERLTGSYVAGDWTKEGVTSRLDEAELRITPAAITSTVRSSSEYTADQNAKENTVFKQTTAPTHLNGRLWLNTSVTPNVLNRSNGTSWVKATPTEASEVGAYSSSDGSALAGRVSTAESSITQTAAQIELGVKTSSNTRDSVVPYNQFDWEQGFINISTGLNQVNTTYIRTIGFHSVKPSTQYVLECSSNFTNLTQVNILWYNGTTFLSAGNFNPNGKIVTSPSNATHCRLNAGAFANFTTSQMPNYWVRVSPNSTLQELSSQLTIRDNAIATKVSSTDLATTLTNYSTITQTADKVDLEIGKVQVGATNMMRSSSGSNPMGWFVGSQADITYFSNYVRGQGNRATNPSYPRIQNWSIRNMQLDLTKQYTLSFEARANASATRAWTISQSNGLNIVASGSASVTTAWKRFEFTFIPLLQINSTTDFFIYCGATTGDTTSWLELRDIQLEIGNKATAYKNANNELSTTNYIFDGSYATFRNGGLKILNNAGSTVFDADVNGNLDITGKITADSGAIGGFSIGAATLSAGTTNATSVGMGSARSDNIAFYAGHLTPTSAPFRVTRAGAMTALSGSVGGWSISSDRIQRGNLTLFASGTNGSININGTGFSSSDANQLMITGSGTVHVSPTLSTNNIFPSQTNTWSLGNNAFRWASIWQQSGAVVGSDLRLKDKIEEIHQAKDFILNLKPVQYVLKEGQSGRKHYGFIAQEVKETMTKVGIDDFGGYIDPSATESNLSEDGQMMALRYDEFIAPMVATIQSQQKKIDELEERLAKLEELLNV